MTVATSPSCGHTTSEPSRCSRGSAPRLADDRRCPPQEMGPARINRSRVAGQRPLSFPRTGGPACAARRGGQALSPDEQSSRLTSSTASPGPRPAKHRCLRQPRTPGPRVRASPAGCLTRLRSPQAVRRHRSWPSTTGVAQQLICAGQAVDPASSRGPDRSLKQPKKTLAVWGPGVRVPSAPPDRTGRSPVGRTAFVVFGASVVATGADPVPVSPTALCPSGRPRPGRVRA